MVAPHVVRAFTLLPDGTCRASILYMSTVANISAALGYDVAETMLAAGSSLSAVLAFEACRYESFAVDHDCSPASTRDATIAPATVRPGKAI